MIDLHKKLVTSYMSETLRIRLNQTVPNWLICYSMAAWNTYSEGGYIEFPLY